MDSFGDSLRAARLRLGLSQRQLAERSGVHQPTIAAIETGRRRPTTPVRDALESAVRVRPSEALAAHRDEVRDAIARHHGTDAKVFGSVARGSDDVGSDLDLMITFPPGADLFDVIDLTDELEQITGVPVDVISGRAAGRVMEHAKRDAVTL
ncbi:helix-turn-helix domain-containing protein [Cellulomonas chengniuliangii]|uniref:helix-turn-helix domain-containing protein n=1 Tax=Cellulomonas chengniuliangii TaxID=2968084 RepID=UPI001D0DF170|nr:XRE family transcriptional regulator [Cellulomonas chengniuliangii]MCC2318800.1 XRE family transcriptional regulator [Cellulomonas chengniuliangii]